MAASAVLEVDCAELSNDEKLALASEISDKFEGKVLALIKRDIIVLDQLTDKKIDIGTLKPVVVDFASRRKDSEYYSLEVIDDRIIVHSADPVAASRRKTEKTLPPNLKQCPVCGSFVTEYDEELVVHIRTHYFGI